VPRADLTDEELLEFAEEYRRITADALRAGDWHEAYRWAKGWIGLGGGARTVEPWLVYVASALLHGQPRTATHSCDLALKNWLGEPDQRAVILYVRGEVIRRHLRDPKTAQSDLDLAVGDAPPWLRPLAEDARTRCRTEATSSRKRKPSVGPPPEFKSAGDFVQRSLPALASVTQPPPVWDDSHTILVATDPRALARPSNDAT
jgi:hypothetical protein